MIANVYFLSFWAVICLSVYKVDCKLEKMKFFLTDYHVTKMASYPRLNKRAQDKSFKINFFKKDYIMDLTVYYSREDALISAISGTRNATRSFLDGVDEFALYQGNIRGIEDSIVLGYFSNENKFRGFVVTDEVYCIEPYISNGVFIVYKFTDIILPGCNKLVGKDIDCSDIKFYDPWKPNKPPKPKVNQHQVFMEKSENLFQKQSELYNKTKMMLEEMQSIYKQQVEKVTVTDKRNRSIFHNDVGGDEIKKLEPEGYKTNRESTKNNSIIINFRVSDLSASDLKSGHKFKESDSLMNKHNSNGKLQSADSSEKDNFSHFNSQPYLRSYVIENELNTDLKNDSIVSLPKYLSLFGGAFNAWKGPFNVASEKFKSIFSKDVINDLNYLDVQKLKGKTEEFQCNLEIVVGPSYFNRLNKHRGNVVKDIYTYTSLLNKIFRKIVLQKGKTPFYLTFNIQQITIYEDDTYSPFTASASLESFTLKYQQSAKNCLTIGFVNRFLASGQFVDGYIPSGSGGLCEKIGNTLIVSHGNSDTPGPMGLFFSALVRGVTRAIGIKDENRECQKGSYPNPMMVLTQYLVAKEIDLSEEYSIFTKCNIKEISSALGSKAFSNCLVTLIAPLCGNGIVEEGETCDCGPPYICDLVDPCCNMPQLFPASKSQPPKGCTLKTKADCSDVTHACCEGCRVTKIKHSCKSGSGACDISFCNGKSASCPKGAEASNDLICAHSDKRNPEPLLCKNLNCSYPLCSSFGLEPCTCAPFMGLDCLYCCLKDGECTPVGKDLKLMGNKNFFRKDREPCMGGVCLNGKCVVKGTNQLVNYTDNQKTPELSGEENESCVHQEYLTIFVTMFIVLFLRYF